MKYRFAALLCLLFGFSTPSLAAKLGEQETAFVQQMVKQHGFAASAVESAIRKAKIRKPILDAISRPAEKRLTWGQYRKIFIQDSRIKGGVKFWNENAELLKKAEQEYGVPPEVIVAIIGVETRYGKHTGKFPVLDALYTLGFHYPPRAKFFRSELEHFLLLAREEKVSPTLPLGSYAGAMGRPQFISSSFRAYAVDFDGDGKRDIWHNNADVIGSVANYFSRHGWQSNGPVTEQVKGVKATHQPLIEKGYKPTLTVEHLRDQGIKLSSTLDGEHKTSLLELENSEDKEHWLGLHNFYVITRYNHSPLYAMAVHQLSQEILKRRNGE